MQIYNWNLEILL